MLKKQPARTNLSQHLWTRLVNVWQLIPFQYYYLSTCTVVTSDSVDAGTWKLHHSLYFFSSLKTNYYPIAFTFYIFLAGINLITAGVNNVCYLLSSTVVSCNHNPPPFLVQTFRLKYVRQYVYWTLYLQYPCSKCNGGRYFLTPSINNSNEIIEADLIKMSKIVVLPQNRTPGRTFRTATHKQAQQDISQSALSFV